MEQPTKLRVIKIMGGKTQFTDGDIIITTGGFSYTNGKHNIDDPHTANAYFTCGGELHIFNNENGTPNVEDWYCEDLLPKFQMLYLLNLLTPVYT